MELELWAVFGVKFWLQFSSFMVY